MYNTLKKEVTMAVHISNGRKLLDAEYDYIPLLNDTIDGMKVLSVSNNKNEEYAVFFTSSQY